MSNSYKDFANEEKVKLLNIGHGNVVVVSRILGIVEASSLPMKRLKERAFGENLLVDATKGRKTRSIIITDSKHVFLSALNSKALNERLATGKIHKTVAQLEFEEGEFVS